ncbi:MAG: purine-binding chemotaxis protein CheW [Desulfobacteraceae bacterium]|nr:purine-binding chemotaxis protein CheW [Desulfobacteraceae bacterium]
MRIQYLIFHIENEYYAIAVESVVEIIPMLEIRRIPDGPAFLEGIINLRGDLIPVMDMTKRLGLERRSYKQGTRIIVIHMKQRLLGLVIDHADDIREAEHEESVLNKPENPFISGILLQDDKMIQVLVPDQILSSAEAQQLLKSDF